MPTYANNKQKRRAQNRQLRRMNPAYKEPIPGPRSAAAIARVERRKLRRAARKARTPIPAKAGMALAV